MFDPSQLESLAKKVAEIVPPQFGEMPHDVEAKIKTTLAKGLQKMDLVSREEFDIQTAVLAKTRAKLEALEKQVAELERFLPDQQE